MAENGLIICNVRLQKPFFYQSKNSVLAAWVTAFSSKIGWALGFPHL